MFPAEGVAFFKNYSDKKRVNEGSCFRHCRKNQGCDLVIRMHLESEKPVRFSLEPAIDLIISNGGEAPKKPEQASFSDKGYPFFRQTRGHYQ
jgi:hypothetical protein